MKLTILHNMVKIVRSELDDEHKWWGRGVVLGFLI